MFHQERWHLGRFDEALEHFPVRMQDRLANSRAALLRGAGEGIAGPDCIIEQERADYDPRAREEFVAWFAEWQQRNPTQQATEPSLLPAWEDDEPSDETTADQTPPNSDLLPASRLTQPMRSRAQW
jgi:hypothetical protein